MHTSAAASLWRWCREFCITNEWWKFVRVSEKHWHKKKRKKCSRLSVSNKWYFFLCVFLLSEIYCCSLHSTTLRTKKNTERKNKSVQKKLPFFMIWLILPVELRGEINSRRLLTKSFLFLFFSLLNIATAKYEWESIRNKKLLLCSNELIKCLSSSVYYGVCSTTWGKKISDWIVAKVTKFSYNFLLIKMNKFLCL